MKECESIFNKGGREAFSSVTLGTILEAEEEPLGMDCREDAVSIRGGQGFFIGVIVILRGGD
eukprot:scaffold659141_cov90-Attheya_sp.AAC.1